MAASGQSQDTAASAIAGATALDYSANLELIKQLKTKGAPISQKLTAFLKLSRGIPLPASDWRQFLAEVSEDGADEAMKQLNINYTELFERALGDCPLASDIWLSYSKMAEIDGLPFLPCLRLQTSAGEPPNIPSLRSSSDGSDDEGEDSDEDEDAEDARLQRAAAHILERSLHANASGLHPVLGNPAWQAALESCMERAASSAQSGGRGAASGARSAVLALCGRWVAVDWSQPRDREQFPAAWSNALREADAVGGAAAGTQAQAATGSGPSAGGAGAGEAAHSGSAPSVGEQTDPLAMLAQLASIDPESKSSSQDLARAVAESADPQAKKASKGRARTLRLQKDSEPMEAEVKQAREQVCSSSSSGGAGEGQSGMTSAQAAVARLEAAWETLCRHEMTSGGLSRGMLAFERAFATDCYASARLWHAYVECLAGRKQELSLLGVSRRAARNVPTSAALLKLAVEQIDSAASGLTHKDLLGPAGAPAQGVPRLLQCGAPRGCDPAGDAEALDAARQCIQSHRSDGGVMSEMEGWDGLLPLALAALAPGQAEGISPWGPWGTDRSTPMQDDGDDVTSEVEGSTFGPSRPPAGLPRAPAPARGPPSATEVPSLSAARVSTYAGRVLCVLWRTRHLPALGADGALGVGASALRGAARLVGLCSLGDVYEAEGSGRRKGKRGRGKEEREGGGAGAVEAVARVDKVALLQAKAVFHAVVEWSRKWADAQSGVTSEDAQGCASQLHAELAYLAADLGVTIGMIRPTEAINSMEAALRFESGKHATKDGSAVGEAAQPPAKDPGFADPSFVPVSRRDECWRRCGDLALSLASQSVATAEMVATARRSFRQALHYARSAGEVEVSGLALGRLESCFGSAREQAEAEAKVATKMKQVPGGKRAKPKQPKQPKPARKQKGQPPRHPGSQQPAASNEAGARAGAAGATTGPTEPARLGSKRSRPIDVDEGTEAKKGGKPAAAAAASKAAEQLASTGAASGDGTGGAGAKGGFSMAAFAAMMGGAKEKEGDKAGRVRAQAAMEGDGNGEEEGDARGEGVVPPSKRRRTDGGEQDASHGGAASESTRHTGKSSHGPASPERKLFLGNVKNTLPFHVITGMLEEFAGEGSVVNLQMSKRRDGGKGHAGFGFAVLRSETEAKKCLAADGRVLAGRAINIRAYRPRSGSESKSSVGGGGATGHDARAAGDARQQGSREQGGKTEDGDRPHPHAVFVPGLNRHTTPAELRGLFSRCGAVEEVVLFRDPRGRSKGTAMVLFQERPDAVATTGGDAKPEQGVNPPSAAVRAAMDLAKSGTVVHRDRPLKAVPCKSAVVDKFRGTGREGSGTGLTAAFGVGSSEEHKMKVGAEAKAGASESSGAATGTGTGSGGGAAAKKGLSFVPRAARRRRK